MVTQVPVPPSHISGETCDANEICVHRNSGLTYSGGFLSYLPAPVGYVCQRNEQGNFRLALIAAGAVVVVGHVLHYPSFAVMIVGALLCFWLRVMAILRGWHLPIAGTPHRSDW